MKHFKKPNKTSLLLLLLLILYIPTTYSQVIQLDSVQSRESRCQYSGTLKLFASGGSGNASNYRYEIIAPSNSARPLQTSNQFTALGADTYTVVVIDIVNNTSDTTTSIVTGNYQIMSPTVTFSNSGCTSGGATATINVSGGLQPYTYQITNPVVGQVQTSNVFSNLSYNTPYTVRVFDSCGNFQTRVITPTTTDNGTYSVSLGCLKWVACDSFSMSYAINTSGSSTHKYPYTLTFYRPDGSDTSVTIASGSTTGTLMDTFYFSGGSSDYIGLSVTNGCGTNNNDAASTALSGYLNMLAIPSPQCNGSYSYVFDKYDNASGSCNHPNPPVTNYLLYNPAGVLVDSHVNSSSFSNEPSGNGYKIVRQTVCGSDSLIFNWAGSPQALDITATNITPNVCVEKTVGASFTIANAIGSVNLIFVSGPASVTLSGGTVQNYVYPDTITNYSNGSVVNYLGAGTYKVYAIDACGHIDSTTLNVNNSLTRHSTATFSVTNGCPSSNQINWNVTTNTNTSASFGNIQINPGNYITEVNTAPATGHYTSLSSGTYYCSFNYESAGSNNLYRKNMSTLGCSTIKDTVIITSYVNPIFYGPSVTNCAGSPNNVLLLPDYTKGVQPFTFQIISGPVTLPAQSSPVFQNLPLGTYTFLMADACGNTYQAQKQISDLTGVAFQTFGSTCENQAATFVAPASPYVSYSWTRPNGSTYSGDTLVINPVTAADTGIYNIRMIVNINGCVDTNYYQQTLSSFCSSITLPITLLNIDAKIQGSRTLISWATQTEINNKFFTVQRSSDGNIFSDIGNVNTLAPNGYSTTALKYSFYDNQPLSGKNIYRIKQTDINGKFTYSDIKSVFFDAQTADRMYPNPSSDKVIVETETGSTIAVYNILGQKVNVNIKVTDKLQTLDVGKLPNGNYTVQVLSTNGIESYKLTVLH